MSWKKILFLFALASACKSRLSPESSQVKSFAADIPNAKIAAITDRSQYPDTNFEFVFTLEGTTHPICRPNRDTFEYQSFKKDVTDGVADIIIPKMFSSEVSPCFVLTDYHYRESNVIQGLLNSDDKGVSTLTTLTKDIFGNIVKKTVLNLTFKDPAMAKTMVGKTNELVRVTFDPTCLAANPVEYQATAVASYGFTWDILDPI